MNVFFRKTLALALAVTLLGTAPAAASDALGEDVTARDTLLHEQTQLSTNVFWSEAYSDLRTENLITYEPNDSVTPIVTYGGALTDRSTLTATARALESQGYRVVAGINGDFYNVNTGLPIGMVVSQGELISSDGGYYAMGFRADGTAVLGKPLVKVTADLGYDLLDSYDTPTEVVRQLTGVNKARVSTGGIYLYTYAFNGKHTTGNTEAGVDVLCTIQEGSLSIGETVTLRAEEIIEATSATAIGPDQVVLSANLQSGTYYVDALRRIPLGTEITLTVDAASDDWDDVDYAVGALYSLVENGSVVSGLPTGVSPRTAVGQMRDGTLVFYTVDGRKSGHSIGASMEQVARRLIELGCDTALCLDGGGSTTLSVTEPDELTARTINTPSDGAERSVSNQIFLVASGEASGKLSHFYVSADHPYVLAGSKVNISASAVDTNYIPMDKRYDLDASAGDLDGSVLTTPKRGGEITVTASSGSKRGETTVHAIDRPDNVAIRNSAGTIITNLTAAPGATTALTGSASYRHISLKADPEAFEWEVSGNIGYVDELGNFTAGAPGTGTITVYAGDVSATISVTVSNLALQTVEDFEGTTTIFRGSGSGMDFSLNHAADTVRMGRGSGKLDYDLTQTGTASWTARTATAVNTDLYTSLDLWVYGDGSGSTLSLLYSDGMDSGLRLPVATLDFTGWKHVGAALPAGTAFSIQGLEISGGETGLYDEWGESVATQGGSGTIYLDQIVASFGGGMDETPPVITVTAQGDTLTAHITDETDGVLPQAQVSVTWDGGAQTFSYDPATGALSTSLISDGGPHRITVTARDASGNIGRASYDLPVAAEWQRRFTDTAGYWGADFVDFLYTAGITTGYDDGTFRPDQNITRAQFAVMLYRYLKLDASQDAGTKLPFADTVPEYAVDAVRALYSQGIINGTTGKDGKLYFNPNSPLTRAQAATMIGRTQAKGYALAELTFTDSGAIPAYAAFYIRTMAAQGVIGGYTDGSFKPNANITRGQMAKILYNLM